MSNRGQRLRAIEREQNTLDTEISWLLREDVEIVARMALHINGVFYRRGATVPVGELAAARNLKALVLARAVEARAIGAQPEERKAS